MVFNDTSVGQVILINIPRTLIALVTLLCYHKSIDIFITIFSERDLAKSGHLQFVHTLREGLVIMQESSFK